MMDMLKFKLISSKMMKGIIEKIIVKKIYQKLGYKIDIQINDIQIDIIDGNISCHLDTNLKMNKPEFDRLLSDIEEAQ